MGETRVIAQGLLCKIFLHCLNRLLEDDMASGGEKTLMVWGEILNVLIRLVGSGQRDMVVYNLPKGLADLLGGSSSRVIEKYVTCHECTGCFGATECAQNSIVGFDVAEIG